MIIITVHGYDKEMRHRCEEFKRIMEAYISNTCHDLNLKPKKVQLVCQAKKGKGKEIKIESLFFTKPPEEFHQRISQAMQSVAKQLSIDAPLGAKMIILRQYQEAT